MNSRPALVQGLRAAMAEIEAQRLALEEAAQAITKLLALYDGAPAASAVGRAIRSPTWDVSKAEAMWRAKRSSAEIAEACGASPNQVDAYASKHGWPPRQIHGGRRITWDVELARELWDAQEPANVIVQRTGAPSEHAIRLHARKNHWPAREMKRGRRARAKSREEVPTMREVNEARATLGESPIAACWNCRSPIKSGGSCRACGTLDPQRQI